jgi:hypothetical protein
MSADIYLTAALVLTGWQSMIVTSGDTPRRESCEMSV